MTENKENFIQRLIGRIDKFQQQRKWLAIPFAIFKKGGDDKAGYQGALMTYYGFVSLFPILIIATLFIDLVSQRNPELHERLLQSVTDYFPAIGGDLQSSVHTSSGTGLGLILGLLVTIYGTRGIANAVRHAMDHVWLVPPPKRLKFPRGLLRSLTLIAGAGTGLLLAALLSSYATAFGHSFVWRALISMTSLFILFWTFCFVFRYATSSKHKLHDNFPGAIVAAVGLQVLQTFGGYLVTHQLKNLNGLDAQFAVVLALLFWLYLQAQVFIYAAEINTVRTLKLWPRSMNGKSLTEGDKRAFKLYIKRATYRLQPDEAIRVTFNSNL